MRRLSLLLVVVALPGCTLLTDFDRDLTVVLEVAGEIPAPRLLPAQRSRLPRCNEFCELARECIRDPVLNPGCQPTPESARYAVANDAFLFNTCVGVCASLDEEEAEEVDGIIDCGPILRSTALAEGRRSPREQAQSLFCPGEYSICAGVFCQPFEDDSTILETCIDVELYGACLVNCERLPAEYWVCVAQDSYTRASGNADLEGVAICNALSYCAGPAEE